MIEYGYVCHNSKILSDAEVDLYNRHDSEVKRLISIYSESPKRDSLSWQALEHAKNQRFQIFMEIME